MRLAPGVEQAIWIVLAGAPIAALGLAAYGLAVGDFRGYVAFGLLVAASLFAVSAGLSSLVSLDCRNWVRRIWVLAMLAAIVGLVLIARISDNGIPVVDAETVFTWVVLILAFPSGLAGSALVAALVWLLPYSFASQDPVLRSLIFWIASSAAGFCQWFVVMPWLTNQVRLLRKPT